MGTFARVTRLLRITLAVELLDLPPSCDTQYLPPRVELKCQDAGI